MPETTNPVEAIFLDALEKPVGKRRAFLEERCCGDQDLIKQVADLLASHEKTGSFFVDRRPGSITTSTEQELNANVGQMIGPYKLLQLLGEGGMGVVYLAERQHPVKQRVALKVIRHGMDTKKFIARFEAERQALAMMDHPNIAKVLDAGCSEAGRPYFVMELVKGVPISDYCNENQLNTEERLGLFVQVCDAVNHAHQKGIIHRDIKPSNVLVAQYDDKPVPKVIDFGVAKATNQQLTEKTLFTEVGSILGTWEYMSPEQAVLNQLDVDTRTDVYSLGVLLYKLLTGETPLDAKKLREAHFTETLRIIREEEPVKPSTRISGLGKESMSRIAYSKENPDSLAAELRGDLDWIVMKSLAKERSRRYDSASRFAEDIRRHLNSEMVEARPPSIAYQLSKFYRRNKSLSQGTLAVVAALFVGLAGISILYFKEQATAQALEDTNANIKNILMKDTLTAVILGDNTKANQSIKFIENDEIYSGDVLLVRALMKLNEGKYASAIRLADQSRGRSSHFQGQKRVGALSIISAAELWGSIGQSRDNIGKLLATEPENDFEALLKAYACGVLAPSISLQIIDDFPSAFHSPVGLFVRGQAMYLDAVNRGDKAAFEKALQAVEWATLQMGEAENAIMMRVLTLAIAIQYAQQENQPERATQLIEEARPWVEKLKRSNISWANVCVFYRVIDDAIQAREACRARTGKNHCEEVFCESLRQTSTYLEAESLFNEIVGKKDSNFVRVNKAHVVRGSENGKQRVLDLVLDTQFDNVFDSRLRLYALSLACTEDELEAYALEVANRYSDEHYRDEELWRGADCIRYLAGDLTESELLALAKEQRYPLSLMHCSIAFKQLTRGDRKNARLHFQLAVDTDTVGSSDYEIAFAYLQCMKQDDSWPTWLGEPVSSIGSSSQ